MMPDTNSATMVFRGVFIVRGIFSYAASIFHRRANDQKPLFCSGNKFLVIARIRESRNFVTHHPKFRVLAFSDVECFDLRVKRRGGDAQELGSPVRAGYFPGALLQRPGDVLTFYGLNFPDSEDLAPGLAGDRLLDSTAIGNWYEFVKVKA